MPMMGAGRVCDADDVGDQRPCSPSPRRGSLSPLKMAVQNPDPLTRVRQNLMGALAACVLAWAVPSAATGFGDADCLGAPCFDPTVDAADAPGSRPGDRESGFDWRRPPPDEPDWRGVRRDIGYFLGYQFIALGVLYVAPESVSGWTDESKDNYSFRKWRDNTSKPVWDEDAWWVNYVTHPYWGGAYYIQARERGLDRTRAFWYSALLSTLYEYGAESLAEPVSIQDLVVTPVGGFLVGEYLFTPWRERIRAKSGPLDWSDKTVLFLTNPLGVLNARIDGWLGVETTLGWQPVNLQQLARSGDDPLPVPLSPAWGVSVRMSW